MKTNRLTLLIAAAMMTAGVGTAGAQWRNDKLANRPYADMRPWHLGFSIGVHVEDVQLTHSGFTTDDGQTWFMEQPDYSPGFCVNGLLSLRLNDYFSVRFSPGMYFGNRNIRMIDTTNGSTESQNVKSTFVVLPLDLKFASQRYRNTRPYITAGAMPAFDVAKKRSDLLRFSSSDCYLTIGFGCDFYLPYFKFIPEIKFCFGLRDMLVHDRPDLADTPDKFKFTQSLSKATSRMIVFSLYFE